MAFRTTPNLGLQLDDVSDGLPFWDSNPDLTEASYRLGNKELGSDGGEYWFVRAWDWWFLHASRRGDYGGRLLPRSPWPSQRHSGIILTGAGFGSPSIFWRLHARWPLHSLL